MSFKAQQITNRFPRWTKIRRDPSSMGSRLFSSMAPILENQAVTFTKLKEEVDLLKSDIGVGSLFVVDLAAEDYYQVVNQTYVYPIVIGTDDTGTYTLSRSESYSDFLTVVPDRLEFGESVVVGNSPIWQSVVPYVYGTLSFYNRLTIVVHDSTKYYQIDNDYGFSGKYGITLLGIDENDIEFQEFVEVLDDGTYCTRNIFKQLLDVQHEGSDGQIDIYLVPPAAGTVFDLHHVVADMDNSGFAYLSLVTGNSYTYLAFKLKKYRAGYEYLNDSTMVEPEENYEEVLRAVFVDESEVPITVVDFCIDPVSTNLLALADDGNIYVYKIEAPEFSPYISSESIATYIEVVPLSHYAAYGDTEKLWTRFERVSALIRKVRIKRTAPDSTVMYLDQNKLWVSGEQWLSGVVDATSAYASWSDVAFSTLYDQIGQWEYECTAITQVDTSVFVTAVLCGAMVPTKVISARVGQSIFVNQNGQFGIYDVGTCYFYTGCYDIWYADTYNNKLYLRTNYSQVEVQ